MKSINVVISRRWIISFGGAFRFAFEQTIGIDREDTPNIWNLEIIMYEQIFFTSELHISRNIDYFRFVIQVK